MGIHTRLNPVDGWISVWWEDRPAGVSPTEAAAAFHEFIVTSKMEKAVVGSETPAVAQALLGIPGFSILGEESRYERIWPSGVAPPDMAGIRPATPADAEVISHILDASFGEAMGGIFPPDRIEREMFQKDWHSWLLEERGHAVGFASVIHGGDDGVVNFIGVVPEAQGKGYGHRLMRLMLAELDCLPHTSLCLTVESHRTRALSLYGRYGFVKTGLPAVNVKWLKP